MYIYKRAHARERRALTYIWCIKVRIIEFLLEGMGLKKGGRTT